MAAIVDALTKAGIPPASIREDQITGDFAVNSYPSVLVLRSKWSYQKATMSSTQSTVDLVVRVYIRDMRGEKGRGEKADDIIALVETTLDGSRLDLELAKPIELVSGINTTSAADFTAGVSVYDITVRTVTDVVKRGDPAEGELNSIAVEYRWQPGDTVEAADTIVLHPEEPQDGAGQEIP